MEHLAMISKLMGVKISDKDMVILNSWNDVQRSIGKSLTDWDPERGLGFLGAWIHNQGALFSTLSISQAPKTIKFVLQLIRIQMRGWILTKRINAFPCFMAFIEDLYRTWTLLSFQEDSLGNMTRYLDFNEEVLEHIQNANTLQEWIDRKNTVFNQTQNLTPVSILRSLFKSWYKEHTGKMST